MKTKQEATRLVVYFFLISTLIIGFTEHSNCAEEGIRDNKDGIPELSALQMASDYTYFINKLEEIYPYTNVWGCISKENVKFLLDSLREQIDQCKSTEEFIWSIYKCLNIFPDKHLEVPHANTLNYYRKNEQQFGIAITDEILNLNKYYYAILHDSVYVKVRLGLRFKYINGEYFSLREFSHNGVLYNKGAELIEINNEPVNIFVQKNRLTIPNICWDQGRNQYYSDFLLLSPVVSQLQSIGLSFKTSDGIHKDVYALNETLNILSRSEEVKDEPRVAVIKDSILYIRMPYMLNEQYYIDEIKNIRAVKENLTKVIIDIRNNKGGMDIVWKKLLQSIIDKPLAINTKLCVNSSGIIKKYISKQGYDTLNLASENYFADGFVSLENGSEKLFQDSLSLNYKGEIYILTDEDSFSAASSLISMSKEDERIVSIGYSSHIIGGRGLAPLIVQLPNSKLIIRIPFTMDCTGSDERNVMNNKPEIEEEYTISKYLEKYYNPNPYSDSSLINSDPLFKRALEL